MYGLCRSNVKDCQAKQRCLDRTDAVDFDAGLCIWNEVRSWSLKEPPYSAYHATRGNFFKGPGLWRFVKAYDRKACTNKAMWEEKENGSDNALCHSYYMSQLLSPMRAPELTGISRQSENAGPVTRPVCSGVGGDLWEKFLYSHQIISLLAFARPAYVKKSHRNLIRVTRWKNPTEPKSRGAVSVLAYAIKFCVTLSYMKLIITIFSSVRQQQWKTKSGKAQARVKRVFLIS